MRIIIILSILLASISILVAQPDFNKVEKGTPEAIIERINDRYFFDDRVWYQQLEIQHADDALVLKGETFFSRSVKSAIRVLNKAGYKTVVDSVTLLPDTLAGAQNWAVVNVTKIMGRYKPVHEKQEATELIYGDMVRLIRSSGDFIQIQTPEGYLCYIPTASVRTMYQDEWDRYHQGPFAVFQKEVELGNDLSINMGSRLPLVSKGKVLLADGKKFSPPRGSFTVANPAKNAKRQAIIQSAKGYLGLPYVWAGRSDDGVDCSGLVIQAYSMHGIFLPRDSDEMSNVGRLVGLPNWRTAILPGDIIFMGGSRRLVTHVGIYMGDGYVIHSQSGGTQIGSWDPASPDYQASLEKTFLFARRVFE